MTLQIQDKLLYKGEKYSLNQELLEPFFALYPDRKPPSPGMMTSLWRGYVAIFEIAEEQLWVKDISVIADIELNWKSTLKHAFPDSRKYDWFSGFIRIDASRLDFQFDKPNMNFFFLEIREGKLIGEHVMDYFQLQQFKAEQFEQFKLTKSYQEEVDRKQGKGMTKAEIDEVISRNMLFYLGLGLFLP